TWLEERFDKDSAFIVRLETMFMHVLTSPSGVADYCGRAFPLLESEHWGTAGYIISKKTMRFFLQHFAMLQPEQIKPIDLMMFSDFFDKEGVLVYQVSPALCAQELHYTKFHNKSSALGSLLEDKRSKIQKQTHKDRTLKERLIHALTKISREKKKWEERKKMSEAVIIPFR
ncbi:TPA: glycosyltransferase family 25 protein, partial [Neisseria meningitidis]